MTPKEEEAMILKYRGLVFSCARSVCTDAVHDEDALQCGLIGLWEACEHWDGRHAFLPFAERCIRCNIIDYYRRKKDCDQLDDDVPCEDPPDREQGADAAQLMAWARACLPKRSREMAVFKALLAGKSKDSIAQKMGVSRRTVHRLAVKAWQAVSEEKEANEII